MIDLKPISVPLFERDGALLVQGTRVSIDTIVHAFQRGATPEDIAQRYPLALPDVYSVISFYLQNQVEVERYLECRHEEAERIRLEMQTRWPANGLRERLLARLAP